MIRIIIIMKKNIRKKNSKRRNEKCEYFGSEGGGE
jgi:hypothetical protein